MKKEILQTVNGFLRSALAGTMVVCALMLTGLPLSASAQTFTTTSVNPEIKYLGIIEGKLVFQIDLKTTSGDNQFVSIRDNEGVVLFTERIGDNQFSRKFAFDQEEFGGQKLSFIIHDANNKTSQAFQVARSMRVVEDVVITKL
ncbi:MAG TPA: hypothetical protein VGE66_14985 [Chitinophagaceae bacterium]